MITSNMTSSEYKLAVQDWIQVKLLRRNMEWFDYSIPLCPPGDLDSNKFNALECMFDIQVKDEIFDKDWLKIFATEILDAKYKNTDVAKVMKGLTHLDAHQKQTYFDCNMKTKRCLMKLLMFIHMKRFSKKDNRVCLISNSHHSENIGICLKRIHVYVFIW